MSLEVSILLLAVCGVAMGLLGGRMIGRNVMNKKQGSAKKLTAAQKKQLRQLESQHEAGLLTKKEFTARKKELLKD